MTSYTAFLPEASMSIILSRKHGVVKWFKLARTEGRNVMVQRELDIRDFWLSNILLSQEAFSFGPHFLAKGRKKTCSAHKHSYIWIG